MILLCLFLLVGCSPRCSDEYISRYAYLADKRACEKNAVQFTGADYALVVLVDARHLQYSNPQQFFETLCSGIFFPTDRSTGHAWLVLLGSKNGKRVAYEIGHTGEFGIQAPKYFDEIFSRSQNHDPNPIKYIFYMLPDGIRQNNSGEHWPSFAAAFPITHMQFDRIERMIEAYDFSQWGIVHAQCVRFVQCALSCIGIDLDCKETIQLPQSFIWQSKHVHLWSDPAYSMLTVNTPDKLEQRLVQQVLCKNAYVATAWYKKEFCRRKICYQ